jgi:hypothetical protein
MVRDPDHAISRAEPEEGLRDGRHEGDDAGGFFRKGDGDAGGVEEARPSGGPPEGRGKKDEKEGDPYRGKYDE